MGSHHFDMAGGGAAARVTPDDRGPLSYMVDAAQGPVRLRYFPPPEHLRAYFGSLYVFTVASDHYSDVTRADVPQMRFMLAGSGDYHFHDGHVAQTPEACLLGPTMGATRFELAGPAHVVGVSVLSAGWIAILGESDMSVMADRLRGPLGARAGRAAALIEALRALDDPQALADRTWAHMERLIAEAKPLSRATWRLLETIDAWLMDEGSPRVEVLAAQTGLSARQIARLTNRYYGAPPKLLARKYRALRCSARIALDGESWQVLCEEGGFYDQPHFIREIKHFVGLTPHQLMTEPSAVAQLTLLRRSLGGDVAVINRLS